MEDPLLLTPSMKNQSELSRQFEYINPSIFRIYFKWQDKRYILGNEGRNTTCPSKNVVWDSKGQFWLPRLEVWDKLKLARS